MRDPGADHVVTGLMPATNSASSGPQRDTERPAEPGRKETQKSQALPSHPKGFPHKRTEEMYINTRNTGDLHQTFNLQLNLIWKKAVSHTIII